VSYSSSTTTSYLPLSVQEFCTVRRQLQGTGLSPCPRSLRSVGRREKDVRNGKRHEVEIVLKVDHPKSEVVRMGGLRYARRSALQTNLRSCMSMTPLSATRGGLATEHG
jgi:hypothetical protein